MSKLFDSANAYVRQSDWKDLALLKICLGALGVIIGLEIPKKHRNTAYALAGGIFAATYIPLMAKFFQVLTTENKKSAAPAEESEEV